MRQYVVMALVLALAIYAWRDWFISLCGLIVLTAFAKHPDMPPALMGVSGLNMLNLLLLMVALAWGVNRYAHPQPKRPVPTIMVFGAVSYLLVVSVAAMRGFVDLGSLRPDCPMALTLTKSKYLFDFLGNPIKHILVAYMLFDGMRSRRNIRLGFAAIVAQALVFSLLAVRYVPVEALLQSGVGSQFESVYRQRFQKRLGFHANDVALAMVAGFWALAAAAPLIWKMGWRYRVPAFFSGAIIALAIALTNSRAGYAAVVLLGLVFGVVRWRWLLVGIPVLALLVFLSVPGVQSRIGLGFNTQTDYGESVNDLDTITAGRSGALWPPAIHQIERFPLLGQGRLTILRTSMYDEISGLNGGAVPTHPHNAYLEVLIDTGLVGLVAVLSLFVVVPVHIYRHRRRDIPILDGAANVGLAGAATILCMGMTGQTFWPREAVDLILCIYGFSMGCFVLGRELPAPPVHGAGNVRAAAAQLPQAMAAGVQE